MEELEVKIDELTGIQYLDELPDTYRPATIDDFHVQGRKKIGMIYLLKGTRWPVYFIRTVNERLTAVKLMPFINAGEVFIKK